MYTYILRLAGLHDMSHFVAYGNMRSHRRGTYAVVGVGPRTCFKLPMFQWKYSR